MKRYRHGPKESMIGQIDLTEAEQELASKIVFDLDNARLEYEQRHTAE
jgi:hypothetical protein